MNRVLLVFPLIGVLASCAPSMTTRNNLFTSNPTAFGPVVSDEDGAVQQITHSALLGVLLPGEAFSFTPSSNVQHRFTKLFDAYGFRCSSMEIVVWLDGDAKILSSQLEESLKGGAVQLKNTRRSTKSFTAQVTRSGREHILTLPFEEGEEGARMLVCGGPSFEGGDDEFVLRSVLDAQPQ